MTVEHFRMTSRDKSRFWNKVHKSSGCWLWQAGKSTFGYGMFRLGPRSIRAHRISAYLHGMNPTKNCILHKCDVPACVNPDHLFEGTKRDNNKDRLRKGRYVCKIPKGDIQKMKTLGDSGLSQLEISKLLGCSPSMVSRVLSGSRRVHQ